MIRQVQEECSALFRHGPAGRSRTRIAALCAMLALASMVNVPRPASAEDTPPASPATSTTLERKEIETIIREYLIANPEILLEAQQVLEAREIEEQRISRKSIIEDSSDDLFNAPSDAVLGNPRGKVTIVEFYDYNCGFCKRALADMVTLTAADPELRFVLKEYPILGTDSLKTHIVSQAFLKLMPDKYAEFHTRMLNTQGRANEAGAIKLALSLGVDEAKLRKAMKDPSITDAFARTHELAESLEITGTPSYVIGNEVIFGALGTEVLEEKITAAKACVDNKNC